ncbi:hypothetical protein [Streptomyces sp. Tu102]|uniref:hypothetical protein n=1 Tax=Streptomyces TaxID=1883 RepID=UPI001BDBCA63|nr:hypothetical protein [Streptomyces sp. Tu102]MBT1098320.1 hypothetical protein [Streptomyces sp. Tu102]
MNRRHLYAALDKLSAMSSPPPNHHLTYSPHPCMFRAPWQRWAWAAVPLGTISAFAFLPFVVAWRRRIVPAWVAGLYTLGSAFWWVMAAAQPDHAPDDRHILLTWALRGFIAIATTHVLVLDSMKWQSK